MPGRWSPRCHLSLSVPLLDAPARPTASPLVALRCGKRRYLRGKLIKNTHAGMPSRSCLRYGLHTVHPSKECLCWPQGGHGQPRSRARRCPHSSPRVFFSQFQHDPKPWCFSVRLGTKALKGISVMASNNYTWAAEKTVLVPLATLLLTTPAASIAGLPLPLALTLQKPSPAQHEEAIPLQLALASRSLSAEGCGVQAVLYGGGGSWDGGKAEHRSQS